MLLVGQKTPKNQVFVFDGKGRKFKTIMLEKLIEGLTSHTKWACMDFNSEEDLVLVTADGRLFVVDLMNGEVRDKQVFAAFNDLQNQVEEAKLEQNTLVLRTKANKFFYAQNVVQGALQACQLHKMASSRRLETGASGGDWLDFVVKVKSEGGRKTVRVLCTDPVDGVHVVQEDFTKHHCEAELRSGDLGQRFGKVKFIAYNSRKDWVALYANAELSGSVIVVEDSLEREINR